MGFYKQPCLRCGRLIRRGDQAEDIRYHRACFQCAHGKAEGDFCKECGSE